LPAKRTFFKSPRRWPPLRLRAISVLGTVTAIIAVQVAILLAPISTVGAPQIRGAQITGYRLVGRFGGPTEHVKLDLCFSSRHAPSIPLGELTLAPMDSVRAASDVGHIPRFGVFSSEHTCARFNLHAAVPQGNWKLHLPGGRAFGLFEVKP